MFSILFFFLLLIFIGPRNKRGEETNDNNTLCDDSKSFFSLSLSLSESGRKKGDEMHLSHTSQRHKSATPPTALSYQVAGLGAVVVVVLLLSNTNVSV